MKKTLNTMTAALTLGFGAFIGACGPASLNDTFLAHMQAKDAEDSGKAQQPGQNLLTEEAVPVDRPLGPQVMQLPSINIPGPSIVERQPAVVLDSDEERLFQRDIHHWRTIHRLQPTINNHTINNVVKKRHFYHTRIVNHPSESTNIFQTHREFESQEVLPISEKTTPLVRGSGPRFW